MTVKTMAVGDEVVIIEIIERYNRGAEAWRGTVVRVGRVWIEVVRVEDNGDIRAARHKFRMDNQTTGTGYTNAPRFYTLDQYAAREREIEVSRFLKAQGISLNYDSPWRNREAELAELLRTGIKTQETS
jgi:hypothetical protein